MSTVSRVERRLCKQPKKDLGMVKSDLGSNCAEFNFSMGGRKQLLPSEASSGHKLRICALWGFFHPKIEEDSRKFREIPSERQIPSWGEKFRVLTYFCNLWTQKASDQKSCFL